MLGMSFVILLNSFVFFAAEDSCTVNLFSRFILILFFRLCHFPSPLSSLYRNFFGLQNQATSVLKLERTYYFCIYHLTIYFKVSVYLHFCCHFVLYYVFFMRFGLIFATHFTVHLVFLTSSPRVLYASRFPSPPLFFLHHILFASSLLSFVLFLSFFISTQVIFSIRYSRSLTFVFFILFSVFAASARSSSCGFCFAKFYKGDILKFSVF